MKNNLKILGVERIGQDQFLGIEGGFGKRQKAILVKDVAKIHHRQLFKINQLIGNNLEHFKKGVDLVDLKQIPDEYMFSKLGFTKAQWGNAKHVYLASERGYMKILKLLNDPKAWEQYNQLVDSYFHMRKAINTGRAKALTAAEQELLTIKDRNSQSRRLNILYKIAMATDSQSSKQYMISKLAEEAFGERIVPVMKVRFYSAEEVGDQIGINKVLVGRIANKVGLKAEQPGQNSYGRWVPNKSRYSDKRVAQWEYTDKGAKAVKDAYKQLYGKDKK